MDKHQSWLLKNFELFPEVNCNSNTSPEDEKTIYRMCSLNDNLIWPFAFNFIEERHHVFWKNQKNHCYENNIENNLVSSSKLGSCCIEGQSLGSGYMYIRRTWQSPETHLGKKHRRRRSPVDKTHMASQSRVRLPVGATNLFQQCCRCLSLVVFFITCGFFNHLIPPTGVKYPQGVEHRPSKQTSVW